MIAPMGTPERIGRYRILGELGKGAMGTVYRARDEDIGRDVALKVMSHGIADAAARERFMKEARAAARLQHPNIIIVYELGEHEGSPFMALELLEGLDLQQGIDAGIRPNPGATLPLVLQVLAGLGHAHDHGIIHRDIKPSNVFLPLSRPAKITDFGVVRLAGAATTTSGAVVGTPNYMSPEQARGGEIDARSDLFSVGLMLYELVTGEKAFRAEAVVAVIYKILHEEPDLGLIPKGPQWERLRAAIARALAKKREDRYPDARTMSSDLLAALSDLGGSMDWMAPADQALLVRPRPASAPPPETATVSPRAPAASPSKASRPTPKTPARREVSRPEPPPRRSRLPVALAGTAGVIGLLALAAWLRFGAGTEGPLPAPTAGAPSVVPTATPPAAAASPSAMPVATPSPRRGASAVDVPPTPAPAAPATPTPALSPEARLQRAEELMEKGRYAQALAEARAVLAADPTNAQAIALAQDAEAAAVVEECLRNARAALDAGDRDKALAETRRGLEVSKSDARLLALFGELVAR